MHTTVRIYRGTADLADNLLARDGEVRGLMEGVSGFQSYQLVRIYGGALSVTTCSDRQSTDETNRIAADWLRTNIPNAVTSPPEVLGGEVVLTFGLTPAGV